MPVDRVAESRAMLDIANKEGSFNNEQDLRSKIEAFQNRFRESRPSVVDVSTDAEKVFRADLESIHALASLTVDREVSRLCMAVVRCLQYLAHRQNIE
jgi:hypothetical protein